MHPVSRLPHLGLLGALMLAFSFSLVAQTAFSVGSVSDLINALTAINANPSANYALTFTASVTLDATHALAPLHTTAAITIDGAGFTLDGGGVQPGFAITGGTLTLKHLTLQHLMAQGAAGIAGTNGGGGSGGGLGAGGALFVDGAANVTLDTVTFASNGSIGGAGGASSYDNTGQAAPGALGQPFARGGFPVSSLFSASGAGGTGFASNGAPIGFLIAVGGIGGSGGFGSGGGGAGASWDESNFLTTTPSFLTSIGGFGASGGNPGDGNGTSGAGGAGLGAGGAIFVASGTVTFEGPVAFTGGSTTNTRVADAGSALFLCGNDGANGGGGSLTFSPAAGQTQTVSDTIGDVSGTPWAPTFLSGPFPTGVWGLTMNGGGTLILSGSNHYTGATLVNAGTLDLVGSVQGTVTVATSGTLEGGGTIKGYLELQAGSTLAPDSVSSFLPSVTQSVTWDAGATVRSTLSVGSSPHAPTLFVGGALLKTGTGTFTFDFQNTGVGGYTFVLANYASTTFTTGDFSAVNLPTGLTASFILTGTYLEVSLLNPSVAIPVSTTPTTASGSVGTGVGLDLTGTNSPSIFSLVAGSLPPGLGIDTQSGQIIGTATAPGTFTATFSLGNAGGATTTTITFQIATSPITVGTAADLIAAIQTVDSGGDFPYSIVFSHSITLGAGDVLPSLSPQGSGLTIDGQSHTLDGGSLQRGFTIDTGIVTIQNLTLQNMVATGGAGTGGGGGGLGAGGAVFVGARASLTLSNVAVGSAANPNKAIGGAGSAFVKLGAQSGYGGGGGMGGAGGSGSGTINGGGGGGFGAGAAGGNAGDQSGFAGSAGILLDTGRAGNGGSPTGGQGGTSGGGGGGGAGTGQAGGGGGNGAYGYVSTNQLAIAAQGGNGGFGGGGGGAGYLQSNTIGGAGGSGGFGGGGGAGGANGGGNGGYGAGGGSADSGGTPGSGGYLGGAGTAAAGGGGAGLGGGLFVMGNLTISGPLTLVGNQVAAGVAATAGNPGSAAGAGLYLSINSYNVQPSGGNVTFAPAAGQTVTISDPIDSDAQASQIVINGAGTVIFAGGYEGLASVVIKQGMLVANSPPGDPGSSPVEVQAGATLAGNGTLPGLVTLDPGSFIAPGNGIGTLTLGSNLSIANGAEILVTLSKQDSTSSTLAITGTLVSPNSGLFTVNLQGTGAGGTTYILATFAQTSLSASAFSAINPPPGTAASFTVANNQLQVTLTTTLSPPQITSATTASGTVNASFSYAITASNSPTSYALSGTLPSGLTFNGTTGTISGTPNQSGSSSVTVSATNAAGTGTQALSLAISPVASSGSSTTTSGGGTSTSSGSSGGGGGGGGPSLYFFAALTALALIHAQRRARNPEASS